MGQKKIYTDSTHPNHKAVKALKEKGYWNILITWEPAISRNRGWNITANDKWLARAYSIGNMIDKINALPPYFSSEFIKSISDPKTDFQRYCDGENPFDEQ